MSPCEIVGAVYLLLGALTLAYALVMCGLPQDPVDVVLQIALFVLWPMAWIGMFFAAMEDGAGGPQGLV